MVSVTLEFVELNWAIRRRVAEFESARDAARALEVSPQTVINWVHGSPVRIADRDMQHKLAAFLDVAPAEVLRMAGFDLSDQPANLPLADRDMRRYPNVTAMARPAARFQPGPAAWTRCA